MIDMGTKAPRSLDALAEAFAALQKEQAEAEALAAEEEARVRDEAIRAGFESVKTAFAELFTTMPEGDKPFDMEAIRAKFAALGTVTAEFGGHIKAPKAGRRTSGTRSHEGSARSQVVAWFLGAPEGTVAKLSELGTVTGRSPGHIQDTLEGTSASGRSGGLVADGYIAIAVEAPRAYARTAKLQEAPVTEPSNA
jgi:hypothetical protein